MSVYENTHTDSHNVHYVRVALSENLGVTAWYDL